MQNNINRTTIVLIVPAPTVSIVSTRALAAPGEQRKVLTRSKLKGIAGTTLNDVFFSKEELMGHGIKSNKIKCGNCGKIIQSLFKYHSVRCSCGKCMIDGGVEELQRKCQVEYTELSEYYELY